jgi:hypothetical protein
MELHKGFHFADVAIENHVLYVLAANLTALMRVGYVVWGLASIRRDPRSSSDKLGNAGVDARQECFVATRWSSALEMLRDRASGQSRLSNALPRIVDRQCRKNHGAKRNLCVTVRTDNGWQSGRRLHGHDATARGGCGAW